MNNGNNYADEFCFGRHDDIGAVAAEDDNEFLKECFIDTGDLPVLLNPNNSRRIIIGRTGAGKSALLNQIQNTCENVIQLSPHSLSLNYIANNNVISFFEEAGVNLSIFYGLLWKHVLVVELLKSKFNITNENSQKDYARNIRKILCKKDKFKEMAVDYLEQWGNKFWLTTEERMHELTQKIEHNLSASIGGSLSGVDLSAKGARHLSEEQRSEVVEIGKKVVSEIQIRELENIITVLNDEIFNDQQQKYFVVIDGLDEEWVDERIKYKLIKSLIDSIRKFKRIPSIKIMVAMRQDLLEKVIHSSRDQGFQEEKYESLYLRLGWTKNNLMDLVDARISFLVQRKYTNRIVKWADIFPNNIDKQSTIDYLTDRTFLRPRDMIALINECITTASGRNTISAHNIKLAEEQYSYKRLQSLATEWQIIYPELFEIAQMLHDMPHRFQLSTVNEKWFEEKHLEIVGNLSDLNSGTLSKLLENLYLPSGNFSSIRNTFFRELYVTGIIGIKSGSSSTINWSYQNSKSLSPGQLKPSSYIHIHPMFYRALDINVGKS
jgi:hypothetical protein